MPASQNFPRLPKDWIEEHLQIQDGQLGLRIYRKQNVQKWMWIVHGQAEQSNRYEHFSHYLNPYLDAVCILDLPGHGTSSGKKGHIEKFHDYSSAIVTGFLETQKYFEQFQQPQKIHWFGHSMGGLITLNLFCRGLNSEQKTLFENTPRGILRGSHEIQSITVSAPLLDIAVPVPPLKKFFGELVEPLLGTLSLSNELKAEWVSRDPHVAKTYAEDPLNHDRVTPRFFVQLTKTMKQVRETQSPLAWPLMMVIPLEDKIVSTKASRSFFDNLEAKDPSMKHLEMFPGYYHESFNDLGKERPFQALLKWIEKF